MMINKRVAFLVALLTVCLFIYRISINNDSLAEKAKLQSTYTEKEEAEHLAHKKGTTKESPTPADINISNEKNELGKKLVNNSNQQAKKITTTKNNIETWGYIKENTEEYQEVLAEYKKNKGIIVIDKYAYIPVKYETGIDFVKINGEELNEARNNPSNIYNRRLEILNTAEEFGSWSLSAEERAKQLFTTYFIPGAYSILVIQCREKWCLSEFTFSNQDEAKNAIKNIRNNRTICQCRVLEHFRLDENIAVLEIEFFTPT